MTLSEKLRQLGTRVGRAGAASARTPAARLTEAARPPEPENPRRNRRGRRAIAGTDPVGMPVLGEAMSDLGQAFARWGPWAGRACKLTRPTCPHYWSVRRTSRRDPRTGGSRTQPGRNTRSTVGRDQTIWPAARIRRRGARRPGPQQFRRNAQRPPYSIARSYRDEQSDDLWRTIPNRFCCALMRRSNDPRSPGFRVRYPGRWPRSARSPQCLRSTAGQHPRRASGFFSSVPQPRARRRRRFGRGYGTRATPTDAMW